MTKKPSAKDLITPPLLWGADTAANRELLRAYFEHLREDPMALAREEAGRLRDSGYFKHMARQYSADHMGMLTDVTANSLYRGSASARALRQAVESLGYTNKRKRNHARRGGKFSRRQLRLLFEAVAARTHNVILSQVMLAPLSVMDRPGAFAPTQIFAHPKRYQHSSYALGFVQVEQLRRQGSFSVSVPFFGFEEKMLTQIAPHAPAAMLEAFRAVLTAGNHDMQHHLTNTTLNPAIANTKSTDVLQPQPAILQWDRANFARAGGDEDERSYESWLILNHARVQGRIMEDDACDNLPQQVKTFMTELSRISQAVAQENGAAVAHKMTDYFGTMLGFVMMRFLPLNDPVFTKMLQDLKQADPLAETPVNDGKAKSAFKKIENHYANARSALDTDGYAAAKIGQIVRLAPEIAYLNVPGPHALSRDNVHVGGVYCDMLEAAAQTAWFLPDGCHTVPLAKDKETIELHCKDGVPYRADDLPAVIKSGPPGRTVKYWYTDGVQGREEGLPSVIEEEDCRYSKPAVVEHYRGLHLPIDPAQANRVRVTAEGHRVHTWYDQTAFRRKITVDANNKVIEDSHPSMGAFAVTKPLAHDPAIFAPRSDARAPLPPGIERGSAAAWVFRQEEKQRREVALPSPS